MPGQPQAAAARPHDRTPTTVPAPCHPLPCTTCLQHIDTGSAKPLLDVITYGFVFSYAYSWPRE